MSTKSAWWLSLRFNPRVGVVEEPLRPTPLPHFVSPWNINRFQLNSSHHNYVGLSSQLMWCTQTVLKAFSSHPHVHWILSLLSTCYRFVLKWCILFADYLVIRCRNLYICIFVNILLLYIISWNYTSYKLCTVFPNIFAMYKLIPDHVTWAYF